MCAPESMGSEDTLFLLYTSGSTGKPKGLVHTQAGYLLYAALTHRVRHHPGEIRGRGWGRLDWGGLNCCCVQEQGQESWHQFGCRGGLAGQSVCACQKGLGPARVSPAYPQPITCVLSLCGVCPAAGTAAFWCWVPQTLQRALLPYDCIGVRMSTLPLFVKMLFSILRDLLGLILKESKTFSWASKVLWPLDSAYWGLNLKGKIF